MSIRSEEVTPPTLIPNDCRNCGGPCYLHTTDSTGIHRVKCGRGLDAACGYCGPFSSRKDEAIRLHNAMGAPAVQATADADLIDALRSLPTCGDRGDLVWFSEIEKILSRHSAVSPKAAQEEKVPGLVNCIRSLVKWHSAHGTMHLDCASDFNDLVGDYPDYSPSGEVSNEAAVSVKVGLEACEWSPQNDWEDDGDDRWWITGCGFEYILNAGNVPGREFSYCPYCGGEASAAVSGDKEKERG